jgi:hypothetical protein
MSTTIEWIKRIGDSERKQILTASVDGLRYTMERDRDTLIDVLQDLAADLGRAAERVKRNAPPSSICNAANYIEAVRRCEEMRTRLALLRLIEDEP